MPSSLEYIQGLIGEHIRTCLQKEFYNAAIEWDKSTKKLLDTQRAALMKNGLNDQVADNVLEFVLPTGMVTTNPASR